MKVIRIVQYEGTEEDLRNALDNSLPLGVKKCQGYNILIAEHLNELPPLVALTDEEVTQTVKTQQLISLVES